jgi:hypothetical protein
VNGRKFTSYAGTATVAGIAAYASYEHMRSLALDAGQSPSIAALLPLSVDGLVVVASVALVDGRERKTSAWFAFRLGITASIVANILAAGPSIVDRCVSAWPSVALLVTIEVIARGGKRKGPEVAPEVVPPSGVTWSGVGVEPQPTPSRPSRKAPPSTTAAARVAKAAAKLPTAMAAEIAALAKVSESTARRHLASTSASVPAQMNGRDVLTEVSA